MRSRGEAGQTQYSPLLLLCFSCVSLVSPLLLLCFSCVFSASPVFLVSPLLLLSFSCVVSAAPLLLLSCFFRLFRFSSVSLVSVLLLLALVEPRRPRSEAPPKQGRLQKLAKSETPGSLRRVSLLRLLIRRSHHSQGLSDRLRVGNGRKRLRTW